MDELSVSTKPLWSIVDAGLVGIALLNVSPSWHCLEISEAQEVSRLSAIVLPDPAESQFILVDLGSIFGHRITQRYVDGVAKFVEAVSAPGARQALVVGWHETTHLSFNNGVPMVFNPQGADESPEMAGRPRHRAN